MYNLSYYQKYGEKKSIKDLPDDVLVKVLSYLDKEELIKSAMVVCKRWSVAISEHEQLLQLEFKGNSVSTENICDILKSAPSLQSIILDCVPNVDKIINQLCRTNTSISEFSAKYCPEHIEESSLENLFRTCAHLSKVNLKETSFSSLNLFESFASLQNLNDLTLSANEEYLGAERLLGIVLNCHHIERLKLYHFLKFIVYDLPTLTDYIVAEIILNVQSTLRTLSLDCTYLTSYSYNIPYC